MAKTEVSKEEFDALVVENQENKLIIQQLIEKVEQMNTATLRGIGIDPIIAARFGQGSKLVQFKRNYHRAAQPSAIQKGANVHESYSAVAGDVVLLKQDECDRIKKDFPDLLETAKSRFKGKTVFDAEPKVNDRGQMFMARVPRKIEAETLIEIAPEMG